MQHNSLWLIMSVLIMGGIAHSEAHHKQPLAAVKIGSRIALLEKNNKFEEALELIKNSIKNKQLDPPIANFIAAKIALKSSNKKRWKDYFSHIDTQLSRNTALMSELYAKVAHSDQQWLSKKLLDNDFFEPALESPCPFFELEKRSKRAEFLYNLLTHLPAEKVFYELYILLPETIDENKYKNNPQFSAWQKDLKIEDFIKRINNLMLFGQNNEARLTIDDAKRLKSELNTLERCELDYENAKIDRRLRKYKDARIKFQALITSCPKSVVQKARYLDLMLASMAGDHNSLEDFDRFVVDYPDHGFSDDVLLFKANMLLDKNNIDPALQVLNKLEKLYPNGDMIERALFIKAFLLARLKQTDKALAALKSLKEKASPQSINHAQAHYWTARLMLFPELDSLESPQKKNIKKASSILSSLASAENPTVYSWLAAQLLRHSNIKTKPIKKINNKINSLEKIKVKNNTLNLIATLIDHGFNSEALAMLDEMALPRESKDLGAMAQAYIKIGRPELAHQKLISCDESCASMLKKQWLHFYKEISWPRPFKAEVDAIPKTLTIPHALIYAVMRQESKFISSARSWAQAFGLMQLVKSTAQEEAKSLGIKKVEEKDLYDPALNLRLGASALSRYWQRFGHLAVALAAYNAGPQAAKKWLENSQIIDTYIENISYKETRSYVKEVLSAAYVYSNYGSQLSFRITNAHKAIQTELSAQ
jgi:outer membrane protein assembly factor BamD (BamD/ComL family)